MHITLILVVPTLILCIILLFNQYSLYEQEDARYSVFKVQWCLGLIILNTLTIYMAIT